MLIIFGFVLCIVIFVICSVLVMMRGLGRVCVSFSDRLDVGWGYELVIGVHFFNV